MKINYMLALGLVFSAHSQISLAGSITDTYANGDTLTAEKLNTIKSAVNSNDALSILNEQRRNQLFAGDGSAGDLIIDRRRGTVLRSGRDLNLTPTELRLLTYFAQHPNQVLSRGQILDAVWGYDRNPETEQVVTVNIRRLREKVEYDPGNPQIILTLPGQGYKLLT